MPKVAGSSFLQQLKNQFGEHELLLDYGDDPVNPLSIVSIDPNRYIVESIKSIVHGHFSPHKYANLNNAFRMTFLRHPMIILCRFIIFGWHIKVIVGTAQFFSTLKTRIFH